MLRQVAGPAEAMSGLAPGLKEFALKPELEKDAREIKAMLAGLKSFRYIRNSTRKNASGQDVGEYFDRLVYGDRTVFWTLRIIGGKLAGLNWENE